MKRQGKSFVALGLALAMVVTSSGVSAALDHATASAAKKTKASVKLNKTKASVVVGKTVTLKVKKTKVKKVKSTKWSTKNKKIATVKKGKVKGVKEGKTTVTCKVKYIAKGSKKTVSKTLKCQVTVKAKTQPTTKPDTVTTKPAPTNTPVPTPDVRPTVQPALEGVEASNLSEGTEVVIEGSVNKTVLKKDNGSVRADMTAQELAETEMGLGINLGNTMEAAKPIGEKMADARKKYVGVSATEYETAWGQPITTQAYINVLHSYGINTIRIPCAWSSMDSEDGTYTINEKYMGRVEEIVNYALNNGMYVIINDHWDYGWWGQFGACMRDADNQKVPDETTRANAWKRYEAYWTQIANRFKGYSDHLIFEGANEELGDRLVDSIYPNGYSSSENPDDKAISGKLTKDEKYTMVNQINQKFVDIVRGSGGNNASRFLLIPGYNTNIDDTANEKYVMPTDLEANGVSKLFVSVHYYTPWDFCGDKGTGNYGEEDKEALPGYLAGVKRFFDAGYGICVGEGGVCNPRGVTGSVPGWFNDLYDALEPYKANFCFWDTGAYFDRVAAKIRLRDMAAMFNERTGSNGATDIGGLCGKENNESDIVDVTGKTPVWSWTGIWYKNGGDNMIGSDRYEDKGGTAAASGQFVTGSTTTPTIAGDATEITFNDWGYHAYIKLDRSKYKNPAIRFEFAEESLADIEENIGDAQLGINSKPDFVNTTSVDFKDLIGKAVKLQGDLELTDNDPYLTISFANKPNVIGIYIYDLEDGE